jgi:hypothetical protein
MNNQNTRVLILLIFVTAFLQTGVRAQTGGGYDLSHKVIASGGGASSGGSGAGFKVEGTVGQSSAGTNSTGTSPANNQYALRGGFWAFQPQLAPTSASVSISGCIRNAKNGIIRRVRVRLTDLLTGQERTALTNAFGYYQFEEVEVGKLYVIRAESKNFTFTPESHLIQLYEELTNVDFFGGNMLIKN